MESNIELRKNYFFEVIERISRFYIHLEEIKTQFYFNNDNKVNDKLIFIQSYKDCLIKYFEICLHIQKDIDKNIEHNDIIIDCLKSIITSINQLHNGFLSHLPRPSEPVELKRFGRIIDKHVVNLRKVIKTRSIDNLNESLISIYLSEEIGELTYIKDPIHEFKETVLNDLISDYNNKHIERQIDRINDNIVNTKFHISIPRIDANNPCRWPTLMHEVAHNLIKEDFFNNRSIDEDFKASLDSQQIVFLKTVSNEISIKHWLTECWCDLFACLVLGPAFWFSQFASYIFQAKNDKDIIDHKYPKALFRLKLIQRILVHRFPNLFLKDLNESINSSESILNYFDLNDIKGFNNNDDIRQLFFYFRVYFLNYFSIIEGNNFNFQSKVLNKELKPLIKYTADINFDTINQLVDSLAKGYPIPSKLINRNELIEKPTFVQEILIAGWLYRNSKFKNEILEELLKVKINKKNNLEQLLEEKLVKNFERFDKSILRSIQVSEWFDLYNDKKKPNIKYKKVEEVPVFKDISILNDNEIMDLIKREELKIIPIMDIEKQLGSTSFDIRLGTSFQLYLHTKYGVIDFADKSQNNTIYNSKMIDLDYLESITISPGQFILGHSMEYIKLPSFIAAEIEGRSSFARLGLQIHMTAGFVDPGFEGVLTFEISNSGPNPIKLYPGLRVAQLRFLPVNKPIRPYDRNVEAKYKGLLTHHDSMQFKDYEISKIKDEFKKINK